MMDYLHSWDFDGQWRKNVPTSEVPTDIIYLMIDLLRTEPERVTPDYGETLADVEERLRIELDIRAAGLR